MVNPKFENYVKNSVSQQSSQQETSRYGVIQDYNPITNTAIVLLPDLDSDKIGEVLRNVPCPVTLGFKMVDPEPGRPCWVNIRRGQSSKSAIITSFFHHNYAYQDGPKQSYLRTGVPRYMNRM